MKARPNAISHRGRGEFEGFMPPIPKTQWQLQRRRGPITVDPLPILPRIVRSIERVFRKDL